MGRAADLVTALPRPRTRGRVGRLEPAAIRGVLVREFTNFGSYWRSTTFSSTIDPTIYLLAFGFGFGSLVSKVGGYDYVDFVGTGVVATAVLFASVFPAMFGTFVKYSFQHTYDAILAAPVDTEELVTGEALWMAIRAGTYGCMPLLVAMVFGLEPRIDMLVVPAIAFISGFGWASFGIMIAGLLKSIDNFNYVTSTVITPTFLVAGTFFPLSRAAAVGADRRQLQPAAPHRRARPSRLVRLGGLGRRRAHRRSRALRTRDVAPGDQGARAQADHVAGFAVRSRQSAPARRAFRPRRDRCR